MKQYITFKWEYTISGVHVSPGSAETLVRGGRKINHDLVAHSLSYTYTHTYTRLMALCLGLARWAGTRKIKPIWILLKQETVSGSGIIWAVCKSASCSGQIMPAPHHSVFTGRMPFLPPNQQRQSTEGTLSATLTQRIIKIGWWISDL